jgi:hypothetical protein
MSLLFYILDLVDRLPKFINVIISLIWVNIIAFSFAQIIKFVQIREEWYIIFLFGIFFWVVLFLGTTFISSTIVRFLDENI